MLKLVSVFTIFFLTSNALALGLCVKASKANLRSGPGSTFKPTWVASRYMPLARIDSKRSWSRVQDVDGEVHWIYTSMLTQKVKCLVIKVPKANLRTGPGSKFPLAEYRAADKYESFKRIKKQGAWYYVENDIGERAWVHETNVWMARTTTKLKF